MIIDDFKIVVNQGGNLMKITSVILGKIDELFGNSPKEERTPEEYVEKVNFISAVIDYFEYLKYQREYEKHELDGTGCGYREPKNSDAKTYGLNKKEDLEVSGIGQRMW